jgi:mannan endo-1,4-beta-mannosidase
MEAYAGRLVIAAAIALGSATMFTTACSFSDQPSHAEIEACAREPVESSGMVSVAAGAFIADDRPFVPRGVGSYPLLEHAGNDRVTAVDDIFAQATALGRPILRTNAYLEGGQNPARLRNDDGTMNEPGLVGLDRLLDQARVHGVKLILVLGTNWSHYGGAPRVVEMVAPGEGLPKDAFWSEPRIVGAQRSFLRTLVSRLNTISAIPYAEDTSIFAWELMNEARCDDPRWCDADTLTRWARVMADEVRAAGARQPIAWGGSGHRAHHGEDLAAIAADGAVDILTLHLYPWAEHSLIAEPGRGTRPEVAIRLGVEAIRDRAALARRFGRALLVEELGWRAPSGDTLDGERGVVVGAWLRAAREEGVGALPWMIAERDRPDYDGLLIRPEVDRATVEALRCE